MDPTALLLTLTSPLSVKLSHFTFVCGISRVLWLCNSIKIGRGYYGGSANNLCVVFPEWCGFATLSRSVGDTMVVLRIISGFMEDTTTTPELHAPSFPGEHTGAASVATSFLPAEP